MPDDTGGFTRTASDDGGFKRVDSRGAVDKLLGLTGPRYQTWPERAARGVYGDIKGAVQAAQQAPIGHAEQMAPQVFEAAKDVVPISPASRVARTIPLTGKVPKVEVPTQEELLSVYKPLEESGTLKIELKPHVLPNLKKDVEAALKEANQRDYLAPQTFRAIEELLPPASQTPTVMDIEGVRRLLQNVNPAEYKAASVVRNKIGEYLSELPDTDVIGGKNVGETLAKVRGNYAAGKKSEMILNAQEKGERAAESSGSGANLDNALRQKVKAILNSPKQMRGVPKAIEDEMRKVVKGGPVTNLARLLSKLGPRHPISGWIPALLADLKGGLGAATASMAAGAVGQKVAEKTTLRKIRQIDEALRKNSPMYKERQKAAGPVIPPKTANISSVPYRGATAYIEQRRQKEEQEKLARELMRLRGGQ